MQRKWREPYSERFRRRAVDRMSRCRNISQLARDLHVCRILLYKWRDRLHAGDAQAQRELRREAMLHNENIRLKRLLGEKAVEVDLNQLWIADITFVRLKTEFLYLAVVLDAFSRKVCATPRLEVPYSL